ncbi:MAG: hypothetical protein EXR72_10735 [Myxococcales bacterium]|nr:hypothetical protein [Myxococcales bacterium]
MGARSLTPNADAPLMALVRAIAAGDAVAASRMITERPALARAAAQAGATRAASTEFFLSEIQHYRYGGDTPLHIAAAAYQPDIARELIRAGRRSGR